MKSHILPSPCFHTVSLANPNIFCPDDLLFNHIIFCFFYYMPMMMMREQWVFQVSFNDSDLLQPAAGPTDPQLLQNCIDSLSLLNNQSYKRTLLNNQSIPEKGKIASFFWDILLSSWTIIALIWFHVLSTFYNSSRLQMLNKKR